MACLTGERWVSAYETYRDEQIDKEIQQQREDRIAPLKRLPKVHLSPPSCPWSQARALCLVPAVDLAHRDVRYACAKPHSLGANGCTVLYPSYANAVVLQQVNTKLAARILSGAQTKAGKKENTDSTALMKDDRFASLWYAIA